MSVLWNSSHAGLVARMPQEFWTRHICSTVVSMWWIWNNKVNLHIAYLIHVFVIIHVVYYSLKRLFCYHANEKSLLALLSRTSEIAFMAFVVGYFDQTNAGSRILWKERNSVWSKTKIWVEHLLTIISLGTRKRQRRRGVFIVYKHWPDTREFITRSVELWNR